MLGFGRKRNNVRLSERQMRELTKNMSQSERKAFEKTETCSNGL